MAPTLFAKDAKKDGAPGVDQLARLAAIFDPE
jgi:hypothetical protein